MSVPGELSAALVLSKCASAKLDSVDASEALSLPGVVAFVDHRCETARVIGQALNTFSQGHSWSEQPDCTQEVSSGGFCH